MVVSYTYKQLNIFLWQCRWWNTSLLVGYKRNWHYKQKHKLYQYFACTVMHPFANNLSVGSKYTKKTELWPTNVSWSKIMHHTRSQWNKISIEKMKMQRWCVMALKKIPEKTRNYEAKELMYIHIKSRVRNYSSLSVAWELHELIHHVRCLVKVVSIRIQAWRFCKSPAFTGDSMEWLPLT